MGLWYHSNAKKSSKAQKGASAMREFMQQYFEYKETGWSIGDMCRAGGCSQAVKATYWDGSPWNAFVLALRGNS